MSWKLLSIASLALLAACASTPPAPPPPKPVVITKYVQPDCGAPPQRAPVELRPVTWQILDVAGQQRFTLTAPEYEDLAFNTSSIIGGVKELQAEIDFYRACVARPPAPNMN